MTIDDLKAHHCILFECISGSRAYGLATEQSDTDIRGIFLLPKADFYGLNYIPQVNNASHDIVYYELGRFVELLLKSNPSALELLAMPEENIRIKHPIMDELTLTMCLSQTATQSFVNYALTQIKKAQGLNKKIHNPLPKERKTLLDFCHIIVGNSSKPLLPWLKQQHYDIQRCGLTSLNHIKQTYAFYYDQYGQLGYKGLLKEEMATTLMCSPIAKDTPITAYLYCNYGGFSSYCKEYQSYWQWIAERNTSRYDTCNGSASQGYDTKNMMHVMRLLGIALQIATQGTFTLNCPNREALLAIKTGKLSYDDILKKAHNLVAQIEQSISKSPLPEHIDHQTLLNTLITMRNRLYHTE